LNASVIKHLPWQDGDRVLVHAKPGQETYGEEGDIEIYEKALACESCFEHGSFFIESESNNCKLGLCWMHLLAQYESVDVIEQKRNWVMFWQTSMNSGVQTFEDQTLEFVRKLAYPERRVHTTIVQGSITEEFGEQAL